ncbi:hypothetical protein ILUMI_01409 [Ignelater luminosus]|uniref:Transforming acidic coiled-coil-containing protein C-terminal domain-containing protein n=1 Tax=Ignelater luminosus TaxID=2038154 RepID=A0A8K0DKB9_IGNLU|nr:hypothetical protein ILUMI_01409 [Ignelater luminosus]
MSLIRLIQESGAGKERPFFCLKSLDYEMENMKQIIKEKNVVLQNNNEKIHELENYVSELQEQCMTLQNQLQAVTASESSKLQDQLNQFEEYCQIPDIINNYEDLIKQMATNYETIKEERNVANVHLANLETGFADLISKYERLKGILNGYQQNQEALLNQIDMYKNVVIELQERYENFKKYANDKLNQANAHVEKIDKKHISELAKVKSKVLQSKVKISELQKTISLMSANGSTGDAGPDLNKKSVFAPLTHFSYR